jgi:hypothetical protein
VVVGLLAADVHPWASDVDVELGKVGVLRGRRRGKRRKKGREGREKRKEKIRIRKFERDNIVFKKKWKKIPSEWEGTLSVAVCMEMPNSLK